jgi:hypothetical protein
MKTENRRTFEYLPLSIRIETAGGVATPVVLRGTPLHIEAFGWNSMMSVIEIFQQLRIESPV